MYERKHCQMEKEECGFLVGAKCKADPNHPFVVDRHFHDHLKIVGCASWSKYLDYSSESYRREHGRETNQMQKLSLPELGRDWNSNNGESRENKDAENPLPMHVLQENPDGGREAESGRRPTGEHLIDEPICSVCGTRSVVKHSDGNRYCYKHYMYRLESVSHERMLERLKGEL